ncbi:MAG: DNA-directed RNA polymerase specialized sigma24 family protein [Planctomycetota bacterium]|jgi:DNA-directed RNA polymerase specialized sigma24 family protein
MHRPTSQVSPLVSNQDSPAGNVPAADRTGPLTSRARTSRPGAGPSGAAAPDLNLQTQDQDRLLAFIRKNMGPKLKSLYEAEDILQDTLLSAHQSPGGFVARGDQADGGVLQWLHTISLHRIWNLSRSLRPRIRPRARTGLPPSLLQFQGEGLEDIAPPSRSNSPLQDLMGPETQREALRAIRELDGDHRLSLVLRGLVESGWPTVTFLTGRKRESARKLHQRCAQSLRERFLP